MLIFQSISSIWALNHLGFSCNFRENVERSLLQQWSYEKWFKNINSRKGVRRDSEVNYYVSFLWSKLLN